MRGVTSHEEDVLREMASNIGWSCTPSCCDEQPYDSNTDGVLERLRERGLVVDSPCRYRDEVHPTATGTGIMVLRLVEALRSG